MSEDYVVGTVQAVFFEKPEDFFKIMLIKVQETSFAWSDSEIVVTGTFAELTAEQNYRFFGQLVTHPKYGQQLKCERYQKETPNGSKALIEYFSGEQFPGIGKKTAEKIVDLLGDQAIQVIINNPDVVQQLPLSTAKKKLLLDVLKESYQTEEIILQLNQLGFGNKLSFKIYHRYQEETLDILHQNPYRLIDDIKGVGFRRADQLARTFGIATDDPQRIQAAIIQTLQTNVNTTGNTYCLQTDLINGTLQLVNVANLTPVTQTAIITALQALIQQGRICVEAQERYFLKSLYEQEWSIAQQLKLLQSQFVPENLASEKLASALQQIEQQLHISYDDNQKQAIYQGLINAVVLLTGGPGTGKTTIINGLVNTFARVHHCSLDPDDYQDKAFPIVLAAPTGRAAKHLMQNTGLPAGTIHRLLGLTGQEDPTEITVNEIQGQLLIIDEVSMVDTELFDLLIQAVPAGMQVVLVGDRDQLPSVGPGQVFSDLITSQAFATVCLTKIYRQNQDSTIIELAHQINQGQVTEQLFQNFADRSFINCDAYQVAHVLQQIVLKSQQKGFDLSNIQILAPMYRGAAGIDHLNQVMQETLNPLTPDSKVIHFGKIEYRIGDKVVQLVNNVEKNVFNGETGLVTGITLAKDNPNKKQGDLIHLNFDGREISYARSDLNNIALAYCTSIHKAQGSEFDLVIVVLVQQQSRMLKRNLLYTAVTRAKSKLIMLGNQKAYCQAIADKSSQRQTCLAARIQETFALKKSVTTTQEVTDSKTSTLTLKMILEQQIDPLIGLNGLKPTDFLKN